MVGVHSLPGTRVRSHWAAQHAGWQPCRLHPRSPPCSQPNQLITEVEPVLAWRRKAIRYWWLTHTWHAVVRVWKGGGQAGER